MSKLVYFLVPLAILIVGTRFLSSRETPYSPDLRSISGHLSVISAEPPADLNFCGERVPMEDFDVKERVDEELQKNVYFYASTILLLKRSGRYKEAFLDILRKNGVPEDFYYLSVAESSLANAVSPVGAKGFWQFMRASGQQFGLEISSTVDERFHPEKATEAAARYLLDAHERFGNWTLVAASYNMGLSGVNRALGRQEVESYYDLHLNRETSQYVFRILAMKTLLENPLRYGFNVPELYEPVPFRSVTVKESIPNLVSFAKEHGSNLRMLKLLNPWLISDRLDATPGKSYEIRFPLADNWMGSETLVSNPYAAEDVAAETEEELPLDSLRNEEIPGPSQEAPEMAKIPKISSDSVKTDL